MAIDDLLHLLLDLLGQDTTTELLEESTVLRLEELSARLELAKGKQICLKSDLQGLFPSGDLLDGDLVEHTVNTSVDKRSHNLGGHTRQKISKRHSFSWKQALTGCTGAA